MPKISKPLGIGEFKRIIFNGKAVEVDAPALEKVRGSFEFLQEFARNKVIYGVNTGFGPMAQYKIPDADKIQLQYNLIRSHASGSGQPIDGPCVRAAMLARLNTLSLGHSGVHPSVIRTMADLINKDVVPLVYQHGGVGASGDLVQLAHLALVLIGEGEVFYKGDRRPTADVFAETGIQPIKVVLREGLALINGTSFMTGIGIVNTIQARRLLDWMVGCSAAINEIVRAYDDHLSLELNRTKMHAGQNAIASAMRNHLADSGLTRKREHHLYSGNNDVEVFGEKVQEYYSLRCVPQILGPVLDTLNSVERILIEEVNSANDNPIVDVETRHVYHGGNFHGDYISLEMDKLKMVVAKMSMLAERQLNYLMNSKLNDLLPPFINLGTLGLNFGLQGVQFTATSTTAENQMLSNPMYVHSIPCNNDNQDIVSMGTNAALIAKKVIENAYEVAAIELMAVVQAIDYLGVQDRVSSKTLGMYKAIRECVPPLKIDEPIYPYTLRVSEFIGGHDYRNH